MGVISTLSVASPSSATALLAANGGTGFPAGSGMNNLDGVPSPSATGGGGHFHIRAPPTPSKTAASVASSLLSGGSSSAASSLSAVAGGGAADASTYDWKSEDNLRRWRGMFVHSLEKVLKQVHPPLVAHEDALHYVEDLILRMLAMLTARPVPTSVGDIEDRVSKTFPTPIDKWALAEAQQAIDRGRKKCSLVLPVDKVHPMLKEVLHSKIDDQVTLYLVAVLEYISADILKVGEINMTLFSLLFIWLNY